MMDDSDDMFEYLRDMMSPADGPDLTDEELAQALRGMSETTEDENDHMIQVGAHEQPTETFSAVPKGELARLREIERLARAALAEHDTWGGPHTQLYLISNEMEELFGQLRAALGEGER